MSRVNVYHRKDGRWEGRIVKGRHKDGKRKFQYVFARTKGEALKKLEALKGEKMVKECHITVSALYEEWFAGIGHFVKESTAANYAMKAQKHILPSFGDKSVDSIVQDDIYTFMAEKKKAGLSPRYIADIIVLMKNIFKFAARTYHVFNPLDGLVMPKKRSGEIRLLDAEEQIGLQNYVAEHQNHTTLGVALSYATGIRIGELCALQWKDIDLKKRILTVRKTMQRIQCPTELSRTKLIITEPKSESSRRCIPIPDCLMGLLRKFQSHAESYVLTGNEKPLEPRAMQYRFRTVLKNADLPMVHFHALRHIFASTCIRLGFDVKALSELLGHSSVEITMNRYVHTTFDQKKDYMGRLKLF